MARLDGKFVWYELLTTDTAAAAAFYGSVVGWTGQDAGMPDRAYAILSHGVHKVAGLMELPPAVLEKGGRPGWMGYVWVDDVDARVARLLALGGVLHHPAEDIPGIGRFAVVADPQGAVLALFRGDGEMQGPPPPPPGTAGQVGWRELMAVDGEAAFDLYADLFGWSRAEAFDMGPMGRYQLFAAGGETLGGMMTKPASVPRPFWLFYFAVTGIDGAAERVRQGGGQVLHGPQEVPGGAWIIQCLDPQGAVFAAVGPRG
jgi:predicted enzyme related to lactoylglutathione lyase